MAAATWRETVRIRPAVPEDIPGVQLLIKLLRESEKKSYEPKMKREELLRYTFGEEKFCYILVAELKDNPPPKDPSSVSNVSTAALAPSSHPLKEEMERLVGYALYYYTYSARSGKILYVEDLFIREEHRGKGLGKALMRECAKIAKSQDCGHMMWIVFDWNSGAIAFYEKIGGMIDKELLTVKMEAAALAKFASDET